MLNAIFDCVQGKIAKITLEPAHRLNFKVVGDLSLLSQITHWMDAYSHQRPLPKLPLDLSPLTPFQQQVLLAMANIPLGHVASYSDLAQTIGRPKAARAVGNACHQNPFPLVLPCHRVVAKSHLGGFAYGLSLKQQLLAFERAI